MLLYEKVNYPIYEICSIDKANIPYNLAYSNGKEGYHDVGTHESEQNCYCRAQERNESEKAHVCSPTPHKAACLVHLFWFYMKILFKPFLLAQSSYAVVEHASKHIASGTIDYKQPGVNTHCH